jgi:hypothetical protein
MLKEYDSVRLRKPLLDNNIPVGSKGVVLLVYTNPRLAYEVEFFDPSGRSLGNFTMEEDHLEKL